MSGIQWSLQTRKGGRDHFGKDHGAETLLLGLWPFGNVWNTVHFSIQLEPPPGEMGVRRTSTRSGFYVAKRNLYRTASTLKSAIPLPAYSLIYAKKRGIWRKGFGNNVVNLSAEGKQSVFSGRYAKKPNVFIVIGFGPGLTILGCLNLVSVLENKKWLMDLQRTSRGIIFKCSSSNAAIKKSYGVYTLYSVIVACGLLNLVILRSTRKTPLKTMFCVIWCAYTPASKQRARKPSMILS